MKYHGIEFSKDFIAAFCMRNHICWLALFGSILGDEYHADSDIDILVRFEPGQRIGLLRMAAIERELAQELGRRVDLRTPSELSRYFRDDVLTNSEVQYAQ